jgi:thiamine pyrophosphokinase
VHKANDPHPTQVGRGRTTTAVVFSGGDPVGADVAAVVPRDALVIAADSGLCAAMDHGVAVDVAVGDFDSVPESVLREALASGTRAERFPAEKDHTDLELALRTAVDAGATRIVVVGGHGGRIDHFMANAMLLASDAFRDVSVQAHFGGTLVFVVRSTTVVRGEPGQLVTLLPVHGPAAGVTTEGLRYALDQATLLPGSTRGVSNELLGEQATVHVERGVLLAILPPPAPMASRASSGDMNGTEPRE